MAHLRLQSARLLLVAASPVLLEGELSDRTRLARGLGAEIPLGWPPALYDRQHTQQIIDALSRDPDAVGWWSWYVLVRRPGDRPLAIGLAGFRGRPLDGTAEINFGIVAAHRGRGYATEAMRALMAWALDDPQVRAVEAEIVASGADSARVLRKLGFQPKGALPSGDSQQFQYVRRGRS